MRQLWYGGIIAMSIALSTAPPATALEQLTNGRILQMEGNIQIIRSGDRAFTPSPGTPLYPGDRLQTDKNSQIWLQCADLTLMRLPDASLSANPCQIAREPDCTEGTYKCPNRGDTVAGYDITLPYVIHPRRTAVLSQPLQLVWNAVPNATTYSVTLEGDGVSWTTQTRDTQITYPNDLSVQPGGDYLLIIEADTGTSSLDEPPLVGGIGFTVLDPTATQALNQIQTALSQTPLTPEAQTLALAHLYLDYHLVSDAILLLENLTEPEPQSASVYRLLGDLYLKELRLVLPAKTYYEQALEVVSPQNLEEKAVIQEELGQIETALDNFPAAQDLLSQAQLSYERLGDYQSVARVTQLIKELQQQSVP